MNNYVTLEQKEKLVKELETLQKKLKTTINIKKKMYLLEELSMYYDILETIYDEYDKLEYYKNLCDTYKVTKYLIEKKQKIMIKNEIRSINYYYDFYKELTKNIGRSLQSSKMMLSKIITNNNLTKSNLENFIEIVNKNFSKDFSNFVYNEIKNNRLLLTDSYIESGICYTLSKKNLHYYICEVSNGITYYDFMTIIHELSHGFAISNYSLFDEIYSIFNEFKLNNIIYNSKVALIDNKKADLYYLKMISETNKNFKDNLKFIQKVNKKYYDINDYDMHYLDNTHEYLISYILGLKLYYQDLEDTELAHYNIKKIYEKNYNDISDINKLEKISIDEILSCEPVKQYVKNVDSKWDSLKK